jgi:hypothetical protein
MHGGKFFSLLLFLAHYFLKIFFLFAPQSSPDWDEAGSLEELSSSPPRFLHLLLNKQLEHLHFNITVRFLFSLVLMGGTHWNTR